MELFAEVIVPLSVEGTFTYKVPPKLASKIFAGSRVIVPFGIRKLYTGIVRNMVSTPPKGINLKPVEEVLGDKPVVSEKIFQFWEWIAGYYMCHLGEVMKAALPSPMLVASENMIAVASLPGDSEEMTDAERIVFELVAEAKVIALKKLPLHPGGVPLFKVVDELFAKGYIALNEMVPERKIARTESWIKLKGLPTEEDLITIADTLTKAKAQQKAFNIYLSSTGYCGGTEPPALRKAELIKDGGVSAAVISILIKKGVFTEHKEIIGSVSEENREISRFTLSPEQLRARDQILKELETKSTVLLHGVTSSGKTEVYSSLIDQALERGEQVLYLLPEIGISSQVIRRVSRYFGSGVELYHSRVSELAKTTLWNRLSRDSDRDKINIIIGVRSAIFLPLHRLGLIIVDEEHDGSYKQDDPAPRYNARDSAVMLANIMGAKTILGSATPSFESYHNSVTGKFGLVELSERYGGVTMPETILSDEKRARKRKSMISHFTPEMIEALDETLASGRQAIIFRNRRGFATMVECSDCGYIAGCPVCDVRLVYHKGVNRAVCHYCGYSTKPMGECKECSGNNLAIKGFGTEKLEDELALIYPDKKIDRIDQDTTRKKNEMEERLQRFSDGKTDILVGTQMITKGLDFSNLNLVGILNADQMLNFPDFRAYEKSYHMLEQVSGRAGRRATRGTVIIQTADPGNRVLAYVKSHQYKEFFNEMIEERKQFGYPPFTRLIRVSLKGKERSEVENHASLLAIRLKKELGSRVLGPEFPPVEWVRSWFVMNILVKIEKKLPLEKVKRLMSSVIKESALKDGGGRVRINVDVDPW